MWIIPTRSRPHNIARLILAWRDTGATTQALLCLDDDDPMLGQYLSLPCEKNRWIKYVGQRRGLADWYNTALRVYPDRLWYGIFADDALPRTQAWDVKLIHAANPDRLAFARDDAWDYWDGAGCLPRAQHFCLGAKLVRKMGWLALPGLERLYIDTVWQDIAQSRGAYVLVDDVLVTHMHPAAGLALRDGIHRKPSRAHDKAVYERWKTQYGAHIGQV